MRALLLPVIFLLVTLIGKAYGAGTVTITRTATSRWEVVTFAFTADSAGSATRSVGLTGRVVKVITNPDGSAAPSANWDVYFYDAEDAALSLTSTALENRHTSNTEQVYPMIAGAPGTVTATAPVAVGNYTFTVSNAGNGGAGRVILYLER